MKLSLDMTAVVGEVDSTSAKAASYRLAKINGVLTLIVPSSKRPSLNSVLTELKAAKNHAIKAASTYVKWATAVARVDKAAGKKAELRAVASGIKKEAGEHLASAKASLKSANVGARAAGIGGLTLPLSTADISGMSKDPAKALAKIRAIKLTEFGVPGKRGTFKPKFMGDSKFEIAHDSTKETAAAKRTKREEAFPQVDKKRVKETLGGIEDQLAQRAKVKEAVTKGADALAANTKVSVKGKVVHPGIVMGANDIAKHLNLRGKSNLTVSKDKIAYEGRGAKVTISKDPNAAGKYIARMVFGNGEKRLARGTLQELTKKTATAVKKLEATKGTIKPMQYGTLLKGLV